MSNDKGEDDQHGGETEDEKKERERLDKAIEIAATEAKTVFNE